VNYDIRGTIRATFALPATAVPTGTQSVANVSFRTRSVPSTLATDLTLEILDVSRPTGDPITSGSFAQNGAAQILVRRVIGDNNANDRLDVGDGTIIQRLLTRLDEVRGWDITGNDMNANSNLDSGDVIKVLRVVTDLEPQPTPQGAVGTLSSAGLRSGLRKAGPTPEQVVLALDKSRGQPGDLVTLQVRLRGSTASVSGASFTLEYPTNALRLINSQSQRAGAMVPSSAVTLWSVAPSQTDYVVQSGRASAAISSATAWPTNEGVLAEFVFQVQESQTSEYRWPIQVNNVEVTPDGYDVQSLGTAETFFIGRNPSPASLNPASSDMTAGGFSLVFSGDAGAAYTIEVSSDLTNWTPLVTLADENGTVNFVDPGAQNWAQRFYRVKQ